MAYIPVGSIIDHKQDPNPTNGPHLDIKINRLYGDRGHINPLDKPELLSRIKIGDNRQGLAAFPITSGYGPRNTGIPGASTYHKGIDYGISAGNQIYWEGEGRYNPENTIGVIYTNDSAGNPYEVLLTHTQLQGATDSPYVQTSNTEIAPVVETPQIPEPTPQVPEPTPQETALERALNYKDMTGSQLNTEYDRLRAESPNTAADEGMKMHLAYFGKD